MDTHVVGPILGSILVLAATEESINKGKFTFNIYSLGLGFTFILSGYLIQKFLIFLKTLKRTLIWYQKIVDLVY
jgi:cytochrome c-type biogenesis protein